MLADGDNLEEQPQSAVFTTQTARTGSKTDENECLTLFLTATCSEPSLSSSGARYTFSKSSSFFSESASAMRISTLPTRASSLASGDCAVVMVVCELEDGRCADEIKDSCAYQSMRHRQKAGDAVRQLLSKTGDWDNVAALRLDRRLTLVRPVLATCRASLML